MPIIVSEKWDSREGTSGDGASTDLRYIIRGTDDDTAARDALVANSPAFYADVEDAAARMLVKRPLAVYVEQV